MKTHNLQTPATKGARRLLMGLVMAAAVLAQPALVSAAGPAVLDLGSTAHFTILAGAAVTSTGGGIINGDVGASPIAGSAIGVTQAQVNGIIYAVDASGPAGSVIAPAMLTTAKGDLTIAYNDAAGRTPVPTGPFLNPGGGNLGGLNIVPGLYKFTSTALITGADLTLTGGPGDVWIFQIAADLQLGSGIHVILAGGAQARNIFWQVGTSAVLGTYSVFKGTILADQAITLNTGSTMEGRALAFEAGVTFNGDSGSLPTQDALPVAQPNVVVMNQDTTYTFLAADFAFTDAENEALAAVKIETLPSTGSLLYDGVPATIGQLVTPADFAVNRLRFTPVASTNGTPYTSFSFSVADASAAGTATAGLTINVTAVNQAPLAVADAYSTPESTTLIVPVAGVLGNDSDADGNPLTAIRVSGPLHGTLTLNANGSFTYVPVALYNGSDSFTYRANDGTLDSNTATASITVTLLNDLPEAVDDAVATPEDTPVNIAVLANDTDVDGDPLTVTGTTAPRHGTAVANPDGTVLYTPDQDYFGPDSFTYTISDGQPPTGETRGVRGVRGQADGRKYTAGRRLRGTDSATVSIVVTPVDDGPRWYPLIPWTAIAMGNGSDYAWYNFEIWDAAPEALGAHKVLETNVKGLAMTTAEEYFMAGSDGLLPGT